MQAVYSQIYPHILALEIYDDVVVTTAADDFASNGSHAPYPDVEKFVEKYVEVPQVDYVPIITVVEVVKQVPRVETRYVEEHVEVPQIIYKEVIVELPQIIYEEVIIEELEV